ncbi:MAG: hypothetical protein ACTSRG_16505 [Candidatus Helarchaeota archaeon]
MSNDEKKFEEIKKQEKQNIPPEVWAQLPDHIKKEIDPNYEPPPPEPVFSGAAAGLEDSINRLRDGFEKIGLTLIGRMGEFATTLERVMMIVARIEKVENLVSEIKYFLKGLQKTLDSINMTLNKLDTLDLSIELEGIKKMLKNPRVISNPGNSVPVTPNSISTPSTEVSADSTLVAAKTNETSTTSDSSSQVVSDTASDSQIEQIVQQDADPKEKVKNLFGLLKNLLTQETTYSNVVKNLDLMKDAISKCYKWVPSLYDIGKTARKFKSKKGKVSLQDFNEIQTNLVQWEQKILSQ